MEYTVSSTTQYRYGRGSEQSREEERPVAGSTMNSRTKPCVNTKGQFSVTIFIKVSKRAAVSPVRCVMRVLTRALPTTAFLRSSPYTADRRSLLGWISSSSVNLSSGLVVVVAALRLLEICYIPVSYTHLDVYKRQSLK